MARLNTAPKNTEVTHEGGPAFPIIKPEQALCRSVMSCLLWEGEFYEDGEEIAQRIAKNAQAVPARRLAEITVEARSKFNLRHVPLLLLSILARTGSGSRVVSDAVAETIRRADELSEFLAVYAKVNGVEPGKLKKSLSAQVKKGLARAFTKFDAYQLGKYNRDGAVKLRDALFLCHAKPKDDEQAALWKSLIDRTIASPDTWEVALSGGADKKETFERLLRENKLGYLALLRNLRNMVEAEVDTAIIRESLLARKGAHRVLPFRYIAAARACPQLEPAIDEALLLAIGEAKPLSGKTVVLVDVSGSMDRTLSARSDLKRIDAAAALASIIAGDLRVFTFSDGLVEVPPRRGMSGVDAVIRSQAHNGTQLGAAIHVLNQQVPCDRLIVITDEQSHDRVPEPVPKAAYMINTGSYKNGVGYGRWVHIDGFSEQVLRFIHEYEAERA